MWWRVVSLVIQPPLTAGEEARYTSSKRLSVSKSRYGHFGEEKNLLCRVSN
jgi:hypothetical protein